MGREASTVVFERLPSPHLMQEVEVVGSTRPRIVGLMPRPAPVSMTMSPSLSCRCVKISETRRLGIGRGPWWEALAALVSCIAIDRLDGARGLDVATGLDKTVWCLDGALEYLSVKTGCSDGERGLDVATGFDRTVGCFDRAFDDLQRVAIAQLLENRENLLFCVDIHGVCMIIHVKCVVVIT